MKKCLYCKNEFEDIGSKGSERLYCSKTCRGRASAERFKNNLIKKEYEKVNSVRGDVSKVETNLGAVRDVPSGSRSGGSEVSVRRDYIGSASEVYQGESYRVNERGINVGENNLPISLSDFIKLVQDNANMNSELKRLNEKVNSLEVERGELLAELDSYEEDEENDSGIMGNGMLSGLVESYKQYPVETINFTKELVFSFFKPDKKPINEKGNSKEKVQSGRDKG